MLTKKSPCSNFHFDRPHSFSYVSRVFFCLLTLFMFPLLCMYPPDVPSLFVYPPHCYSPSFCCQTLSFKKKKLLSPFYCCKTFVLFFSLLFKFTFFISFCETTSVFLLLFGFLFFTLCNLVDVNIHMYTNVTFEKRDDLLMVEKESIEGDHKKRIIKKRKDNKRRDRTRREKKQEIKQEAVQQ